MLIQPTSEFKATAGGRKLLVLDASVNHVHVKLRVFISAKLVTSLRSR